MSDSRQGRGVRTMKNEMYESNLKDLKEERSLSVEDKKIAIKYKHYPNIVGPRSEYHGVPIWVGKTEAEAFIEGKTVATAEARCWLYEPFSYSQARVVVTGRLLKKIHLPTKLAEQVKE